RKRLEEVGVRLAAAPGGMLDLQTAAGYLLEIYSGDTFYAWLELVVAARTDPALNEVLRELDARFVEGAERLCKNHLLPHGSRDEVRATTRLILAIFDGLATHRILTGERRWAGRALARAAGAGLFGGGKGKG